MFIIFIMHMWFTIRLAVRVSGTNQRAGGEVSPLLEDELPELCTKVIFIIVVRKV